MECRSCLQAKGLSVAWCRAASFHHHYTHYAVHFLHLGGASQIAFASPVVDVWQARCFKLVRFSCICLAVCCFVFAFGVVSFFDLPIVSLLVLIAAEGHKGTAK